MNAAVSFLHGKAGTDSGARQSRIDSLKAQARKPGEASFFYRDHHFQYDAVKVLPGEYFVSKDDLVIMTVLGSCISACIWDSSARVGGMNHFMLPDGDGVEGGGTLLSGEVEQESASTVERHRQGARRTAGPPRVLHSNLSGAAFHLIEGHLPECGG